MSEVFFLFGKAFVKRLDKNRGGGGIIKSTEGMLG